MMCRKRAEKLCSTSMRKKMDVPRASNDMYNGGGEREREREHNVTLYWNRNRPQKRLYRSAVSRERFTAVALVLLMTTGMKLYSPNMHALNPMYSSPERT